ncbi:MAG: Brp/Blh family beta-carotene 15,15'-dioxygenase [Bacteroidota bacterium]
MHSVAKGRGGVSATVMAITVVFCLIGGVASNWLGQVEPFLVLGMMLILGLPHGATDHGLFESLPIGSLKEKGVSFYLAYVLILGVYGLLWMITPLLAFGIFLLLSVYHFGQSNWADVRYGSAWLARAHYVLWGAGVLLTPIFLYAGEAATIVTAMTGYSLSVPSALTVGRLIGGLAVLNIVFVFALTNTGVLNRERCWKEILGYGLLMTLFFTNSLLLGFTVYFVFWHSLASLQDQLTFFKQRLPTANRRRLLLEIGTVVGGALAFCMIVWFGPGPAAALEPAIIGKVFILISILTLPHMLLVEQLYQEWSDSTSTQKISKPQSLIRVPSEANRD